jgi:hypothetical protein
LLPHSGHSSNSCTIATVGGYCRDSYTTEGVGVIIVGNPIPVCQHRRGVLPPRGCTRSRESHFRDCREGETHNQHCVDSTRMDMVELRANPTRIGAQIDFSEQTKRGSAPSTPIGSDLWASTIISCFMPVRQWYSLHTDETNRCYMHTTETIYSEIELSGISNSHWWGQPLGFARPVPQGSGLTERPTRLLFDRDVGFTLLRN